MVTNMAPNENNITKNQFTLKKFMCVVQYVLTKTMLQHHAVIALQILLQIEYMYERLF